MRRKMMKRMMITCIDNNDFDVINLFKLEIN